MTQTELDGKVALVTGAAKRVGAEIARVLHSIGMNLVIHYQSSEIEAQALFSELQNKRANSACLIAADLTDPLSYQRVIDKAQASWKRLDVLVNNASTFYPTPLKSIEEHHWEDLIGTNLKAPLFLSQAAADHLRKHRGVIINITDIHAERPLVHHGVYCVAKAGLVMLTRTLARDLGPEVRVNAIAPGIILWPEDSDPSGESGESRQQLVSQLALAREGTASDIAATVQFLVRDAPYITGQNIVVDGGRTIAQ